MANVDTASISTQIYTSRDQIRTQVLTYLKTYMDLSSVDLTKSSFVSFLVDIISTLTSNLLFYETSVYREFFMTLAQLPESVLNLASFLGYSPKDSNHASANVLMTIPFGFIDPVINITIPSGFKFFANDIIFVTFYETSIIVSNNRYVTVKVTDEETNRTYNLPVSIDTTADMDFSFILPTRQYEISSNEFQIDSDLKDFQFYNIDVDFSGKISEIDIKVREADSNIWDVYTEFDSLYLMSSSDKGFVARRTTDGVRIYFGNDLIGKRPGAGATVKVVAKITKGTEGNVVAGAITSGQRIYTTTQAGETQILNYSVINVSPATGGIDDETIDRIKINAIDNLTARNRLVSEKDYKNVKVVIPDCPLEYNTIPVLKRSDLKVNEIELFAILLYGSDIVPTRNAYETFDYGTTLIPKNTIITIDGTDYYTLFDILIDSSFYLRDKDPIREHHYTVEANDLVDWNPIISTSFSYTTGVKELEVYKNGLLQNELFQHNGLTYGEYTESSLNTVTFKHGILNIGDIISFRATEPPGRKGDFVDVIEMDSTSIIDIDLTNDFSLVQGNELRVFINGYLQTVNVDYTIDYTNHIVSFSPGILNPNDIIRFRSISQITVSEAVQTSVVSIPDSLDTIVSYEPYKNDIEFFLNKVLQSPVYIQNNNVYGHYCEIDETHLYLPSCPILTGDTIITRSIDLLELWTKGLSQDSAKYQYIVENINQVPILEQTYDTGKNSDFTLDSITITSIGGGILLSGFYSITTSDSTNLSCQIEILETSQLFEMTNDFNNKKFEYYFSNINILPQGSITCYFVTKSSDSLFTKHYMNVTFRMDLSSFMRSNVVINDSTSIIIYDIPVIEKSYYDNIEQSDFESLIIQKMMETITFSDYRMLTDFVNLKFCNTIGISRSMQYNTPTKTQVLDIRDTIPLYPIADDRYIVNSSPSTTGEWANYNNYIATYDGTSWIYVEPFTDDIVYIDNFNKKYVFTGTSWIDPEYNIPLNIHIEVFKDSSYTGNDRELINTIKVALLEAFSERFGPNIILYRSELYDIVQEISGVNHCNIISPKSDIFFNRIDTTQMTQNELLIYTPDYIYFTENSISIEVK